MASWEPLLEELVLARHQDLVAYATMLTGNRSEAEDLVQDALIESFGKNRRFDNVFAAEGYVRKVISSRFIDGKRRAQVRRRLFARIGTMEVDPAAGPETLVEHATDVRAALAGLGPRERACVVLRYLEHQSTRETAEALGLSEGAVKRYLSDGIAKLNQALGTDADASTTTFSALKGAKR